MCMRKLRILISIFTVHIFFLNVIATAQENINTSIQKIAIQHKATGLSVAVMKKNKIVYTYNWGYKDVATKQELTNNDIFRIASISKSFTATAIMQLVEAGKCTLSDDISDLVGFNVRNPKYPDKPITLKMLLSHRSGLNDKEGYFTLDAINPDKNKNYINCYNNYPPDGGYQYCNLNFNIAGTIVERLSDTRFDRYIQENILQPLGLYGGYCIDSLNNNLFVTLYEYDAAKDSFIASPNAYHPRREEISTYRLGYSAPIFSPTGGMKISATDLAKYMTMHCNYGKGMNRKRIISKKSARIMQTSLTNEEGYGLALSNTTKLIKGVSMTGHTGSAYGLYSSMFFNPKRKYGFVVITNGCKAVYSDGYVSLLKETVNELYNYYIKN